MKTFLNRALLFFFLVYSLSIFFNTSCDKIETPLIPQNVDTIITNISVWDDTSYSELSQDYRIVLVEEYTGHTCQNCPDGAREIEQLIENYPGRLMAISIHAGFFAEPLSNSDSSYSTDFRTSVGNTYYDFFGPLPNPVAFISRIQYNGNIQVNLAGWEPAFNSISNDPPIAQLDLTNLYSDSLNAIRTTIDVKWNQSVSEDMKLQVFLVEDHVIDWQKDGPDDIPDYDHKHVLRTSLNGIWGEPITTALDASYEYTLSLDSAWDPDNCEVIAYIYDPNTFEVFQCNYVSVK